MDEDGYPTEETLERVRTWEPKDFQGLAEFLVSIWHYPEYITLAGSLLRVSTGGWSGHEDIIGRLRENHAWWAFHWQSHKRGGHYVFKELGT